MLVNPNLNISLFDQFGNRIRINNVIKPIQKSQISKANESIILSLDDDQLFDIA